MRQVRGLWSCLTLADYSLNQPQLAQVLEQAAASSLERWWSVISPVSRRKMVVLVSPVSRQKMVVCGQSSLKTKDGGQSSLKTKDGCQCSLKTNDGVLWSVQS